MMLSPQRSTAFGQYLRAAVEAALKRKGISGRQASLDVVGHDGLIRDIRAGRIPSADRVQALAEALDMEFYFGPRRETGPIEQIVLDSREFVHVPLHEASLAAGDGAHNDAEDIIDHLAFRRSWLTRIGVSASSAVLARAAGDSMSATIHNGDMLLIDSSKCEPPQLPRSPKDNRPAPIYAVLDDGAARVKRIELVPGGTLALLSDNTAFAPEFRPVASVSIIGRVMWWGHTNRD